MLNASSGVAAVPSSVVWPSEWTAANRARNDCAESVSRHTRMISVAEGVRPFGVSSTWEMVHQILSMAVAAELTPWYCAAVLPEC